ncbi:MAG: extracellular solute-binding protein [Candidatus Paceibacterota bacterium]|jgi:ABC-type glycerol-3-phosphate transport system substrate-binding protein
MNTRFQTILTIVFLVLAVLGIVAFATLRSGSSGSSVTITLWGTVSRDDFTNLLSVINQNRGNTPLRIEYTEKKEATLESDLVEALAKGEGPDTILLPQNLIIKQQDKLYPIPFTVYPEATFKNTFVEAGNVFLTKDSVLALPFQLDPLVLYWNRDLYTGAGIAQVPRYWDTFFNIASKLTVLSDGGTITKSALSLGEYQNILHASDIFMMLTMQAGGRITSFDSKDNRIVSTLDAKSSDSKVAMAESALNFYTTFANPNNNAYSWNRSFPLSDEVFVSGDSATYIGYLSEFSTLRARNPNLNFDVAVMPQSRVGRASTYANILGIAILKRSPNVQTAYVAINDLLSLDNARLWAKTSGYPPVRRDLAGETQSDNIKSVGYSSAIIAKSWTDPDSMVTEKIVKNMIESVLSGNAGAGSAVSRANKELQNELDKYNN